MIWLASSHYEIHFSIDSAISERGIFPISAKEQRGIEDARFVKFVDEDGEVTYYKTYRLVITHAVGSMREYTLSASLYSLDDPEVVIGRLNEPLMVPNEEEREGYVPNVIYSCGSIVHQSKMIM